MRSVKIIKKLSIILFVLFSLFSTQTYACDFGPIVHKVTTTIDNVEYDSFTDSYYLNSIPDASGSHWVLDIDKEELGSVISIEALTAKFKGVTVDVYYVGDIDSIDEVEIVTSRIIKGDEL